jgi:hypothetical protein
MNNVFNFTRFSRLFYKHTTEHFKTYLMSTGVLIGILTLIFLFISYVSNGHISTNQQGIIFFNLLFFSGTVFTSMIFADLGDRKKSIPMLTLPVSHFEKYLVAWVYSFVIFQLVFIGCYYLVDSTVIKVGNSGLIDKSEIINVFSPDYMFWVAFPQYALLHAICFFGAIFFEKLHFIKTAFLFFIFIMLISMANPFLLSAIFGLKIEKGVPFNSVGIMEADQFWFIRPTETSYSILLITVFLVSVILWLSTYFKLKEKQV